MPTKDIIQITAATMAVMMLVVVSRPMLAWAVCAIKSLLAAATAIATAMLTNMEKST
ncbi:Uncharacterised protein [uncultured archaeon]|nr:Uncharacterised protein [uncultured archaeon]VVB70383.1 Uncharacterised protein [uncultured archaeon]